MTPHSKRELLAAVRPRYRKATRSGKVKILDEFVASTGYHRKYAIHLLNHGAPTGTRSKRRSRRSAYWRGDVIAALVVIWEACDRICSRRLQPHIPEMIDVLERHRELSVGDEVKDYLRQMSRSTIDRLLAAKRRRPRRRGLSTTKPGTLLKRSIPVRMGTQWEEDVPGFVEVDLVAHCGDSAKGEFIHTLNLVDICTSWTACRAVPNRGQKAVFDALVTLRRRLPFDLRGIDSDNGPEFINQHLFRYCQKEEILFTRSRPYRKNDQAYIEQKNWSVVRRQIGYDRYESAEALEAFNELYDLLSDYVNFFLPVLHLASKTRVDGKVKKKYDPAQTPYQRVMDSPDVSDDVKAQLKETYLSLNPVAMRKQIDKQLDELWRLAVQ